LNLDDILDAAIAMLPHDAYAMVLLVDHDIYESADDDFCAGRAYGGSRVSVVQSARYNPLLDSSAGITRDHAWPASHCKTYIDSLCAVEDVQAKPATATQTCLSKNGPMRAAVDAVSKLVISDSKVNLEALWSSRVIRTVSHELGHCLCLAHCFFYACIMQSTASLLEDVRQAPYLCPTCDAKTSHTIVVELQRGTEEDRQRWVRDRYSALKTFCEGDNRMEATLWAGFHGWLGAVLENRDG
jgi:archaemetzincin